MAQTQLRRKFRLVLNLYETLNENRLKTGGQLTATLYPAGVQIEEIDTIPIVSVSTGRVDITCSGRGSLEVGDYVKVLRQTGYVGGSGDSVTYNDWVDQPGSFLIESINEINGAPGQFVFRIYNSSGTTTYDTAIGDRFTIDRSVGGQELDLYEDETDTADTISQPIDVPTNGVVEGYCDVRGMDVYLEGSIIDNGWYAFNVPTGSGLTGPMTLKMEEIANAGGIVIDATTSIVKLTTGSNPLVQMEDAVPGRLVAILPGDAALQLATNNSGADNTFYEATGRTIDLDQDVPLWVMGVEGATPDVAYWVLVGAAALVDLGLGELNDVATAGAADGEVLGYTGGTWGPVDEIGTAAAPLQALRVDDGVLYIHNGASIYGQIFSTSLTASRQYLLPNYDGILLTNAGNFAITGDRDNIAASGSGFALLDTVGGSRRARFDLSGITISTTHVYAFPDDSGTFALVADLVTSLDGLSDVAISAPTVNQVLAFNGSNFVNASTIGSVSNHLSGVVVEGESGGSGAGLTLVNSTGGSMKLVEMARGTGSGWGITAYEASFPPRNGGVLLDNTNQKHVTVSFPFNGTTDGLFNWLSNNNGVQILALNTDTPWFNEVSWVVQKLHYQWHFDTSAVVATPFNLMLYAGTALPTGGAAPPTGTAQIASTFSVPSSVTQSNNTVDGWETTGVQNSGPGGSGPHKLFLGIASGSNGPSTRGVLTITVEYMVTMGRVVGSTEVPV